MKQPTDHRRNFLWLFFFLAICTFAPEQSWGDGGGDQPVIPNMPGMGFALDGPFYEATVKFTGTGKNEHGSYIKEEATYTAELYEMKLPARPDRPDDKGKTYWISQNASAIGKGDDLIRSPVGGGAYDTNKLDAPYQTRAQAATSSFLTFDASKQTYTFACVGAIFDCTAVIKTKHENKTAEAQIVIPGGRRKMYL